MTRKFEGDIMIKEFSVLRKIELTEEQNTNINKMIDIILNADKENVVQAIFLSASDVTNGVLNNNINPRIYAAGYSFDFYEKVKKESPIMPEFDEFLSLIPEGAYMLWRRN